MKTFLILLFSLALCGNVGAAIVSTNRLDTAEAGSFAIAAPLGTKISAQPTPGGVPSPTITVRSPTNDFALEISFFADKDGKVAKKSDLEIEESIRGVSGVYLRNSVEQALIFEKFRGTNGTAYFARFTDATFSNKKRNADEFPNIAAGVIRWKGSWAIYKLFSRQKNGGSYRRGMDVLTSIRPIAEPSAKTEPAAEESKPTTKPQEN